MADEEHTIRYVIDIDTSKGTAQVRDFLEDEKESAGGGSRKPPRKPSDDEDEALGIAESISKRLKAGAIGALAFAQSPGQTMGAAGALVGGPVGMTIAGFGVLADKLTDTVRSLAEFDGGLFASTTELDFFMMGWKIEAAQGISDAFQKLLPSLEKLMIEVLPVVIDTFNLLATVAKPAIDLFSAGLREGKGLLDKINQGWGHIIDTMVGMPGEEAGRTFTDYLGLAADSLSGLAGSAEDVNRQYEMMLQGHAISTATLTALDMFAKGEGHGSQGLGGPRFEQEPPVSLALAASTKSASSQHSAGAEIGPGAFPRPTPAAVNFKAADTISVQAGDEAQLFSEMNAIRGEVMSLVQGLMDQRWMKLAEARAVVSAGFGSE